MQWVVLYPTLIASYIFCVQIGSHHSARLCGHPMVQHLPKYRDSDVDRTVWIWFVNNKASLFEILLAKMLHGCASFKRVDALQVDTEERRIEVNEVAIDFVSHLLVVSIKI